MEHKSLYPYYWFGTCLRYLQDAAKGTLVNGEGRILHNINALFRDINQLGLPATKSLATEHLNQVHENLKKYADGAAIEESDRKLLREGINTVRTTLDVEIKGLGAYVTTPKRLDINKLLNDVGTLFAPGVFDSLPQIAIYDFQEAGKCIAFERPTAAAFHCLRGTEDVLRFYCQKMIRQKRIKSQDWGPIVTDLRARPRTSAFSVLNNHLDNIRDSFRNPTQHPEARYDIHEAQDLFSLCVEVINRMIGTLKKEQRF
jgi:hypothetical protein